MPRSPSGPQALPLTPNPPDDGCGAGNCCPRQPEAYAWFTVELANLRTAFRWAADHGDLDVATPIATCAAWLGFQTENYEPTAWAEELIEPARAIDRPRRAALYVMASLCYMAGRIDPAIRYTEAAQRAISGGSDHVPYGAEGFIGSAYPAVGQPERMIRWCRAQLARSRHPLAHHDEPGHRTDGYRLR